MDPLRLVPHLLLLTLSSAAASVLRLPSDDLYCDSWRVSVEANNAQYWYTVPARCEAFVEQYMNGERYASDLDFAAAESLAYAQTVKVAGDGKDLWVFDTDETLLSNLPYYVNNGYVSTGFKFNQTSWDEWESLAKSPALPANLKLYNDLLGLGFRMVIITGRPEARRNLTEHNLLFAGYHSWERLILRQAPDIGKTGVVFKSERRAELEAQGYRIHGNCGDQWSDLLGPSMAHRSFKFSNPMYFIA